MRLLRTLWTDDCGGGLLSTELLMLFTILVLGGMSGMVAMRQAVLSELLESAQAVLALNQSHSFSGQINTEALIPGSSASDMTNTISGGSSNASHVLLSGRPMD
jgi:hypothetical protein